MVVRPELENPGNDREFRPQAARTLPGVSSYPDLLIGAAMRLLRALQRIHHELTLGDGRWIAWIMYAQALPSYGLPAYRRLRYNTRKVMPEIVDESKFVHQDPDAGVVSVMVHLTKYTITPWLGRTYELYATYTYMQLNLGNYRPHFERSRAFVDWNAARADFLRVSRTPAPAAEHLVTVEEDA